MNGWDRYVGTRAWIGDVDRGIDGGKWMCDVDRWDRTQGSRDWDLGDERT